MRLAVTGALRGRCKNFQIRLKNSKSQTRQRGKTAAIGSSGTGAIRQNIRAYVSWFTRRAGGGPQSVGRTDDEIVGGPAGGRARFGEHRRVRGLSFRPRRRLSVSGGRPWCRRAGGARFARSRPAWPSGRAAGAAGLERRDLCGRLAGSGRRGSQSDRADFGAAPCSGSGSHTGQLHPDDPRTRLPLCAGGDTGRSSNSSLDIDTG